MRWVLQMGSKWGPKIRWVAPVEAGGDHDIDFAFLLADDHRLYLKQGYELLDRHCTFLGIDEHQSLGQLERDLSDCLMVKPLGERPWPTGEIDFLGYLF